MLPRLFLAAAVAATVVAPAAAQTPSYDRKEDVIYGRKFGTALTMDVFTPKEKKNGVGVIFCVSGGWFSAKAATNVGFVRPLLDRGYTVFAVVHGSQPKFTIPEVLEDMHRATRYVRHHAKAYDIDPDRIGIMGGSAGGHLSLMQGTAFKPGDPKATDPVDRESSKANAVACFFPPTDFFNWGQEGVLADPWNNVLSAFKAPFDFHELDPKTRTFERVADPDKRKAIYRAISPLYHVTKESAPALIIHGDKDRLVPLNQAELMIAKLKDAGVPCELVVKEGADHGWAGMDKDVGKFAEWFDTHLKK